jgi:hypothetical protein
LKCTGLKDEHVLIESRELFDSWTYAEPGVDICFLSLDSSITLGLRRMLRKCIKVPIQECGSTVLSRNSISCAILKTQLGNRKRLLVTAVGKSSNASHMAAITARNERERQIIRVVEQRMQTRQILLEEVCFSPLHRLLDRLTLCLYSSH